jgi:hypothetical protein
MLRGMVRWLVLLGVGAGCATPPSKSLATPRASVASTTVARSAAQRPTVPSAVAVGAAPSTSTPRRRCGSESTLERLCELWLASDAQQRHATCGAKRCETTALYPSLPQAGLRFHRLLLDHSACSGEALRFELVVGSREGRYWPMLELHSSGTTNGRALVAELPFVTLINTSSEATHLQVSFNDGGTYSRAPDSRAQFTRHTTYTFSLEGETLKPLSRLSFVDADPASLRFFPDVEHVDVLCDIVPQACNGACPF